MNKAATKNLLIWAFLSTTCLSPFSQAQTVVVAQNGSIKVTLDEISGDCVYRFYNSSPVDITVGYILDGSPENIFVPANDSRGVVIPRPTVGPSNCPSVQLQ